MKIWVYAIWILSFLMWVVTIILEYISSKAKEEKQVDSITFYSYLTIIFLLFTMIGAVLLNLWR